MSTQRYATRKALQSLQPLVINRSDQHSKPRIFRVAIDLVAAAVGAALKTRNLMLWSLVDLTMQKQ